MQNDQLQEQINKLRSDLDQLSQQFYKNNFSATQVFNKYSNFTTGLKIPHYDSVPATCEVGEIIENSGKALICASANTWVIIGTQS